MSESPHLLAITACPSGVAHTYMAAEHLEKAAQARGFTVSVETHGAIGVEGTFTADDIARAQVVVIAADKQVPLDRFVGKRIAVGSAADGIHHADDLIDRALAADPLPARPGGTAAATDPTGNRPSVYRTLMNGVSHMIPFVVVGGLLLAVAFGVGGHATEKGLVIPDDSVWSTVMQVGALAFGLMVPILSGYIAYAIADRPGLAPGMVTGLIAVTPALYHSKSGAGFLGGIITGFLSGYIALGIKRIKVHKYIQPIWPIIVIPVFTTLLAGGIFIYVLGQPIAALFSALTDFLAGMQGSSAILLGLILGAMISFDMGGPVNKVAFLFAGGLIASGNTGPMGMVAVAIAVPPIGLGIASLIGRRLFTNEERQNGIAAICMGFFGITEGAIPFAAARPLQIIPANMIGGAVGAAVAGAFAVEGHVMWGGVIDVIVGGIGKPAIFLLALGIGVAVTATLALTLVGISVRRTATEPATAEASVAQPGERAAEREPALVGASATAGTSGAVAGSSPASGPAPSATSAATATPATTSTMAASGRNEPGPASPPRPASILDYISEDTILLDAPQVERDEMIAALVASGVATGQVGDEADVVAAAKAREAQHSTAVGFEIAIPHAKTDGVARPMVAFARTARGIPWDSPAGDLARLVFLIAVPKAAAGDEHLRILARLSRALIDEQVREALFRAGTTADVLRTLQAAIGDD